MLPRAHRLSKKAEVARVIEGGSKTKFGPLLVFHLPAPDSLRVAVAVSKKVSKAAVRRNYLRRLLSELLRQGDAVTKKTGDVVFHILYDPKEAKTELSQALERWQES